MQRRLFLGLAALALPVAAHAQPAPRGAPRANQAARHDQVLSLDYDALPPGARERVNAAFKGGSASITDADVSQRWNAMTPAQRGEVLTMQDRRAAGRRGGQAGQGPRQGAGPRAGAGGRGPGRPRASP